MGVGKAVLGSHRPSNIVWSENGPCCGTIAYIVGGKEGRIWFRIICLEIYQFDRTTWWCLSVLEYVLESIMGFVLKFSPKYVLKSIMLKSVLKNQGLPKFALGPPLGGSPDENSGRDHETLSIVRHVGLHVDSPSMKSSSGLWAFTFVCEVNLNGLRPFDQWELLDCNQWSWAFSLVCEMALRRLVVKDLLLKAVVASWRRCMFQSGLSNPRHRGFMVKHKGQLQ